MKTNLLFQLVVQVTNQSKALFLTTTIVCVALLNTLNAQNSCEFGTVVNYTKISSISGNFSGELAANDYFGTRVASLGDLDKDGVTDIAVSAPYDDDINLQSGSVWILFLNADGTVKTQQKISMLEGNFNGELSTNDRFGMFLNAIGDINQDGTTDLAVSSAYDDDGGVDVGAVWILMLSEQGTVIEYTKISKTSGNFNGEIENYDFFGYTNALGDFNNDGVIDLVVGAPKDDDGGIDEFGEPENYGSHDKGAVWVLFMNADGTVQSYQKISSTEGNLNIALADGDWFGYEIATLADMDGDNVPEIAVSALKDDDAIDPAVLNSGAVYILYLNADGTVKKHTKISATEGNFGGSIGMGVGNYFGNTLRNIGDLDLNGIDDLAVTENGIDDGGINRGGFWVLMLNKEGSVDSYFKISNTEGNFTAPLKDLDYFGSGLAPLGDIDNDGNLNLAVSAMNDDDGGTNFGALYILNLCSAKPDPCKDLANMTTLETEITMCQGNTVEIGAATTGTLYWSTDETSTSIVVSPESDNMYFVTTSDANGCTEKDSVLIHVAQLPIASAGDDKTIFRGTPLTLNASGGTSFIWSTNELTQTITVTPDNNTIFTVTVTDANGCSAMDEVNVKVNPAVFAVSWTKLEKTIFVANDSLLKRSTKLSTWLSGAASKNMLPKNTDGFMIYTVNEASALLTNRKIGFSISNTVSNEDVDYGFYFSKNTFEIIAPNVKKSSKVNYTMGDKFVITRTDDTIKYYRNNILLKALKASTNAMIINAYLKDADASFKGVLVSFPFKYRVKYEVSGDPEKFVSINTTTCGGYAPYTYIWNNGSTQEDLTNVLAGIYTVTVTDNMGITLTKTIEINSAVSKGSKSEITDNETTLTDNTDRIPVETVIYPNPATDYMLITLGEVSPSTSLNVFNMLGEIVLEQPLHETQTLISVSHLAKGIYTYNINNGQSILSTNRLIIE